jgi:hypothetical protein
MSKGNEILLRARQHARASRTTETLKSIQVPEWDCTLYFWPDMSVDEKRAVFRHGRVGEDGSISLPLDAQLDAAIDQVLHRARDELANRLFNEEQAAALADTHPDVLIRISGQMGWGARRTQEDAEKN